MARTPKSKGDRLVVYPKQWPDTRVDKQEVDKDEPVTPHLGHEYRLTKKFSEQTEKPKSARETFFKRFRFTRAKHMPHPAPIVGGHYKSTPQMEKPHYEETEAMTQKTYTEFVTEAAKRGRPRKLRPGEEADTLHIQDQLNKLTHPNHVEVHFKDGSKHRIPREHANMALHHLNSLKPIDRADHAEHMAKSHSDFYHVLSKKSIPSKKKGISLAGPKLRKEEVEQIDELTGKGSLEKIRDYHKNKQAEFGKRAKGLEDTTLDRYRKMKSTVVVTHSSGKKEVIPGHGEAEFTSVQRNKDTMKAKRDLEGMKVKRATGLIKKRKSMKEEAEQFGEEWGSPKIAKGIRGTSASTAKMSSISTRPLRGKQKKPKVQQLDVKKLSEESSCNKKSYKQIKTSLMKNANREKDASE